MKCPRRSEVLNAQVFRILGPDDHWEDDRTCSFCGSLEPAKFFELVEAGAEIVPTDKNYKAYVRPEVGLEKKFYYQHLDSVDRDRFILLYNSKQMKIGLPGDFYVLPFFCGREPQDRG